MGPLSWMLRDIEATDEPPDVEHAQGVCRDGSNGAHNSLLLLHPLAQKWMHSLEEVSLFLFSTWVMDAGIKPVLYSPYFPRLAILSLNLYSSKQSFWVLPTPPPPHRNDFF